MSSRTALSGDDARRLLADLPHWSLEGAGIVRHVRLSSFRAVQRLVDRLCDIAEGGNHHPDLSWTYDRISIRWSTHDAGGLTKIDFRMAALTDHVVEDLEAERGQRS
jgi:4a-hydroxytetrahydrobiopterin dehydratase